MAREDQSHVEAMIEVDAAELSECGPRPINEDRVGSHVPDDGELRTRKGVLFVLADGVGGHQAGEVASELAVRTILDEYFSPSSHVRVEPALQRAVQTANLRIYERGQRDSALRSMETTVVALALTETHAYVAHAGDSRVYHLHAGELRRLTNDHSEAAELVRLRLVEADRLREHPRRNVLTRTLGSDLIVRPDFSRLALNQGDRFLLCSDGLWSELSDAEIAAVLGDSTPTAACRTLVDRALARGSADNVSVQVVRVAAAIGDSGAERGPGWRSRLFVRQVKAS